MRLILSVGIFVFFVGFFCVGFFVVCFVWGMFGGGVVCGVLGCVCVCVRERGQAERAHHQSSINQVHSYSHLAVHEDAGQVELHLEADIHVGAVDRRAPPQREAAVGDLVEAAALRVGELLELHRLLKAARLVWFFILVFFVLFFGVGRW